MAKNILATELQLRLSARVQTTPPLLVKPASILFHYLFSRDWGMAFGPLLVLGGYGDWRAHDFMLSVGLSGLVCGVCKHIIRSPRPFWVSANVRPAVEESTWATPSAHAATGAGGAFICFFHSCENESISAVSISAVCAILTVLFASFSRVFLGVHWPQDVAIGSVLGMASGAVVGTSRVHERLAAHVAGAPTSQSAALGYIIAGLVYLAGVALLVAMLHAFSEMRPVSWAEQQRYQEGMDRVASHVTKQNAQDCLPRAALVGRFVPRDEESHLIPAKEEALGRPPAFFADRKEKFWFNAWCVAGAYFGIAMYVAIGWSADSSLPSLHRHALPFVNDQERFAWLAAIFATSETILLVVLLRHWVRSQLLPVAFFYMRQAVYLAVNLFTFGLFPLAFMKITIACS